MNHSVQCNRYFLIHRRQENDLRCSSQASMYSNVSTVDLLFNFLSQGLGDVLTEVMGAIMLSPTLRPSMFTLASCFLVPIFMNSVLLSFKRSLSLIIHNHIACMHCSIASTASFCEQAESALNDRYS